MSCCCPPTHPTHTTQQAARQAELDEGLVCIKAGVRQREGWAMKERIRDKVRLAVLAF